MTEKSEKRRTDKRKRRFKFQLKDETGVVLSTTERHLTSDAGGFFFPLTPCTPNDSARSGTSFVSNGPNRLKNINVQLIFWGSAWAGNLTGLGGQITNSVQRLLAGPYMTYLAQYGIGRGSLLGTTFVTNFDPPNNTYFDNFGNPLGSGFTFLDIANFIQLLLDNDNLPEPDSNWPIFYCVIMPPSATLFPPPPPNTLPIVGANSSAIWNDYDIGDVDNDPAHFAWVGNDGTLDYVTYVLSHELVEAVTDPDGGPGIRLVPCAGSSCQIGDPCLGTCDRVDGVQAQGYWSQLDGKCITPTWYSVKRTLFGRDLSQGIKKTLQPNSPIPSLRTLVASLF